MGAFLLFCPREGSAPGEAFLRARSWLTDGVGLAVEGEGDGVVRFARRHPGGPSSFERLVDGRTVVPDPLGRLHVYSVDTPAGALVSTSSLALARAVGAEADPVAVREFLMAGTLYEDRTLFTGVRRLQGGFRVGEGTGGTLDDLLEACERTVRELPGERALSDLTGGLDSRLVLGLLLRSGRSFDVTVSGVADSPDVLVARGLAKKLGLTLLHDPSPPRLSFEHVLAAAALTDGEYDAIEYARIAATHEAHAGSRDLSINGSGGEVYRNYWWNASHLSGEHDCVALAAPRFSADCIEPPFMAGAAPAEHFEGVVRRTLQSRSGDPAPAQLDHAYLHLRMQCWQGAIHSATNRIRPVASPLMERGPLEALYALPPRERLGNALIFKLLARMGHGLSTHPLESGFPALAPGLRNAWRFVPGLLARPADLYRRLQARRDRRGRTGGKDLAAFFEQGAADYLRPAEMASAPLFDELKLATFLEQARTGKALVPLVGRLLAVEFALRNAGG